jgi:hypothetical protein
MSERKSIHTQQRSVVGKSSFVGFFVIDRFALPPNDSSRHCRIHGQDNHHPVDSGNFLHPFSGLAGADSYHCHYRHLGLSIK